MHACMYVCMYHYVSLCTPYCVHNHIPVYHHSWLSHHYYSSVTNIIISWYIPLLMIHNDINDTWLSHHYYCTFNKNGSPHPPGRESATPLCGVPVPRRCVLRFAKGWLGRRAKRNSPSCEMKKTYEILGKIWGKSMKRPCSWENHWKIWRKYRKKPL